jgi:hypothetical protein
MLLPLSIFAQTKAEDVVVPKWGKIDTLELQMKDCDFEPGAAAVKLLDWAEVYYELSDNQSFFNRYRVRMERRIRIKILKPDGLQSANVKIPYISTYDFQSIGHLRAYTYNLGDDGKIIETKVENRSIFNLKLNQNLSQKTFTFPAVKVGSVIEYRYQITTELSRKLTPWFFQADIPTKLSQYNLSIPSFYNLTPNFTTNFPVLKKEKIVAEGVRGEDNVYQYNMLNVPSMKDEPYMSSFFDWLQRVEFSFNVSQVLLDSNKDKKSNWSNVNISLLLSRSFGGRLDTQIRGSELIIDTANQYTSTKQKVSYLYNYVRKNWNWNERMGIYCDNMDSIWKEKKGDKSEINFILLNLLLKAKVEAYPICTSTKENGQIHTDIADANQFDGVDVLVFDSSQIYLLDATQKYIPYYLIPSDVLNTQGFIVDERRSGWARILDGLKKDKNIISIQANIDSTGKMQGDAMVFSYDYAKTKRLPIYENGYEKFKDAFFASKLVNIDTIQFVNPIEEEKAFEQRVTFNKTLDKSADYAYFKLNMLTDLESNPFTNARRFSNIDFGVARSYIFIERFILDSTYQIEGLPDNKLMIMPDTSIVFKRISELKENVLSVRIELDFQRSVYSAEEYPEFKEFYKKLYGFLDEQIVLKRKEIVKHEIIIREQTVPKVKPAKDKPKIPKKNIKHKK